MSPHATQRVRVTVDADNHLDYKLYELWGTHATGMFAPLTCKQPGAEFMNAGYHFFRPIISHQGSETKSSATSYMIADRFNPGRCKWQFIFLLFDSRETVTGHVVDGAGFSKEAVSKSLDWASGKRITPPSEFTLICEHYSLLQNGRSIPVFKCDQEKQTFLPSGEVPTLHLILKNEIRQTTASTKNFTE